MGNEFKGRAAHSAEYFGDTRDHWWNLDFLRLMARRWKLDAVRDVLDVGCGVGHWGVLLAAVLPEDARVTGVDREPAWVDEARARALARGLGDRFSYQQGVAERLPFPDDAFDLTTCQTVLIHAADPAAAIAEMLRVTRPGGLVAVAEPNNLTAALLLDSISNRAGVDDIVELVRFQLTCERGKVALGEGDNSLGDRVPGLFVAQGLVDVQVFANDRVTADLPALRRGGAARRRRRCARPCRAALLDTGASPTPGGSSSPAAAPSATSTPTSRARWPRGENIVRGMDDATYHGIVGGAFYLVSGRKRR